jgi:hypothetical protein
MKQKQTWFAASALTAVLAVTTALAVTAALPGPLFAVEPGAGSLPAGAGFELFTASEAAAWNTTQPKESRDFSTHDLRDDNATPTCRSTPNNDADNPQIRIVAPTLGKTLTTPIDIELLFVPTGSTAIRPDTFRVCYMGLVTMDITKRITDRVPVSDKGLRVSGAQLPHGQHRLVMLVADERGRLARREAVFDIE